MWFLLILFLPLALALAADPTPPPTLYIYRDFLKAGSDEPYRKIEDDAARICAEMKCPNPYIGIESLTGPKEAWWLNGFRSEEAMNQVGDHYAKNKPLAEALNQITKRKAALIGEPWESPAKYREDLSEGPAWGPGQGRFLVITIGNEKPKFGGTVFEAPDGTRFSIRAAQTRAEADEKAAGSETRVFAVRPNWSMPSKEWVAADPEFWRSAPIVSPK